MVNSFVNCFVSSSAKLFIEPLKPSRWGLVYELFGYLFFITLFLVNFDFFSFLRTDIRLDLIRLGINKDLLMLLNGRLHHHLAHVWGLTQHLVILHWWLDLLYLLLGNVGWLNRLLQLAMSHILYLLIWLRDVLIGMLIMNVLNLLLLNSKLI